MHEPAYPPKPGPGNKVAVLSPSAGLPELFPLPFETGLQRIRDDFGLIPVEYPTTRRMSATAADRAADINAAFGDPEIKAIIASIGGEDQITVTPHLDDALIRANPKPFFGYSDNVNIDMDWEDPRSFDAAPPMESCAGWDWHHADRVVESTTWGGELEILSWLLMADRDIRTAETYQGMVLLVETSEALPSATRVFRILRNMGERGLLRQFSAVLFARPKAWSFEQQNSPAEKTAYAEEQRKAALRALSAYAPEAMVVFDVDFGHADPQLVIPYGGRVRVDGPARRITVTY